MLKELIETEKHYVADLGLIVEVNLASLPAQNTHTHSSLTEKRGLSHRPSLSERALKPYHHNSSTLRSASIPPSAVFSRYCELLA